MAQIRCEVEDVDLAGGNGRIVPGVMVTCTECGLRKECFGSLPSSVTRAIMMLKQDCNAGNYYFTEEKKS